MKWPHTIFTCPECLYHTDDTETATTINDMLTKCPVCNEPLVEADRQAWCNLKHPTGDCGWYKHDSGNTKEPTETENAWEEGYQTGKDEAMTEPTRRYEQMEYDLEQARTINDNFKKVRARLLTERNQLRDEIRALLDTRSNLKDIITEKDTTIAKDIDIIGERQAVIDQLRTIIDGLELALVTEEGQKEVEWERGYRHGLAQCNHHPALPELWVYSREDHTDLENAVNAVQSKIDELQTKLSNIETMRN